MLLMQFNDVLLNVVITVVPVLVVVTSRIRTVVLRERQTQKKLHHESNMTCPRKRAPAVCFYRCRSVLLVVVCWCRWCLIVMIAV